MWYQHTKWGIVLITLQSWVRRATIKEKKKEGRVMTREQARNLLMLPKKASREQIDEHYQLLREFYFPPIYELNYKRVPEKVKQWLYREKRGGFYEGTNGVNYLELPDDPGFVAFTLYTKICEAYECLTDEKNKNKYDVDPNTAFGKDTLRFGPVIGWIKRIISAMVKKAHWLLLAIIVTAIVWFMIAPLRDFFFPPLAWDNFLAFPLAPQGVK